MGEPLEQVIARQIDPPDLAVAAMALGQVTATAHDLVQLIEAEPDKADEILCIANSSLFDLPTPISTVDELVASFSGRSIIALASSVSVVDVLRSLEPIEYLHYRALCQHAVIAAVAARQLLCWGVSSVPDVDDAFLCGIMHDVGLVMMAHYSPRKMRKTLREVERKEVPLTEAEHKYFGVDHPRVGRAVAELWGMPKRFLKVVDTHHNPRSAPQEVLFLANATYLACTLTRRVEHEFVDELDDEGPVTTACRLMHLPPSTLPEITAQLMFFVGELDFLYR